MDLQRLVKVLSDRSPPSLRHDPEQGSTRRRTGRLGEDGWDASERTSPSVASSRPGAGVLAAMSEGWELDGGGRLSERGAIVDPEGEDVMGWEDTAVGVRVRMEADPSKVSSACLWWGVVCF